MNRPLICIEVGNTSVRICRYRSRDLNAPCDRERRIATAEAAEAAAVFDGMPPEDPVLLAGVVRPVINRLAAHCHERDRTCHIVAPSRVPRISNMTREPEAVGVDRLLTAAAGVALYTPPLMVIDVGSAVTYNLVDDRCRFLGGMIAPGPDLMARSLHDHTDALPRVPWPPEPERTAPELPGRDTATALRAGVWYGLRGQLRECAAALARSLPGRLNAVIVTGGNAAAELWDTDVPWADHGVFAPDLLLQGMRLYARESLCDEEWNS